MAIHVLLPETEIKMRRENNKITANENNAKATLHDFKYLRWTAGSLMFLCFTRFL